MSTDQIRLTPAQQATVLYLDESEGSAWRDLGFKETRVPTCRVLYKLGLVEVEPTQWRSVIVSGGWGRRWTTKNVASTPIRLTPAGRELAAQLKEQNR